MSDRIVVFESPVYGEEARSLTEDPIITEMTRELFDGGYRSDTLPWGTDSTVALNEYKRRGGTGHRSIGGPARAIKLRLTDIGC